MHPKTNSLSLSLSYRTNPATNFTLPGLVTSLVWLYSCVNLILFEKDKVSAGRPLALWMWGIRPTVFDANDQPCAMQREASLPEETLAISKGSQKYWYTLILTGRLLLFLFSLQFYQFKMISFFYNATFNPDLYCLGKRRIQSLDTIQWIVWCNSLAHTLMATHRAPHFDTNQCVCWSVKRRVRSNCYARCIASSASVFSCIGGDLF